jgi:hypothetical protein
MKELEKRGDATLTSFAAGLAVFSLAFGIYMNVVPKDETAIGVTARNSQNESHDWKVPVVQKLDPASDDIITGSISRGHVDDLNGARTAPVYRLVSVVGARAYVAEVTGDSRLLIAVTKGSIIAGAGRVLAIENRAGRWVVFTTRTTITTDAYP